MMVPGGLNRFSPISAWCASRCRTRYAIARITRTWLLPLEPGAQEDALNELYASNCATLLCVLHFCNANDIRLYRFVDAARETWPKPEWQLAHISNGREFFADRRHSDLITEMPDA